jgi:Domain of unknown function (DUF4260)
MKTILKLEYLGGLALSMYLFSHLPYAWWWYLVLFFLPDIGMIGYLMNPKIGAATYNLMHHIGLAVLMYILGSVFTIPLLQLAGVVLIGHLFFDRFFGYGLKYADRFKNTHLGVLP